MIKLSKTDFSKLKAFYPKEFYGTSTWYQYDENTLLKCPDDKCYDVEELIERVEFLQNVTTKNCITPLEVVLFNHIMMGYLIPYIPDAQTFMDGIDDKYCTYQDRLNIIYDVYQGIKSLHQKGIVIGDVHLKNFLYNKEQKEDGSIKYHGYLIDLDDCITPGEPYRFDYRQLYTLYNHKDKKPFYAPTMATDNIKATICALSFLLQDNLESCLKYYGSIDLAITYLEDQFEDELLDQIVAILYGEEEPLTYLDDVLKNYEKTKVKKR